MKQKSTAKVRPGNIAKIGREMLPIWPTNVVMDFTNSIGEWCKTRPGKCFKVWPKNVAEIGKKIGKYFKIRTCMSPKHQRKASTFLGCLVGRFVPRGRRSNDVDREVSTF